MFSISFKEISENLKLAESETIRIIECLIGSAFSWFMIFGLIGLFGILAIFITLSLFSAGCGGIITVYYTHLKLPTKA